MSINEWKIDRERKYEGNLYYFIQHDKIKGLVNKCLKTLFKEHIKRNYTLKI